MQVALATKCYGDLTNTRCMHCGATVNMLRSRYRSNDRTDLRLPRAVAKATTRVEQATNITLSTLRDFTLNSRRLPARPAFISATQGPLLKILRPAQTNQ